MFSKLNAESLKLLTKKQFKTPGLNELFEDIRKKFQQAKMEALIKEDPRQAKKEEAERSVMQNQLIFPIFKKGPLEEYRKKASFCWKHMRVLLEGEDAIRLKHRVWSYMEQQPEFYHEIEPPSLSRARQLAHRRCQLLWEKSFYGIAEHVIQPNLMHAYNEAIFGYEMGMALKFSYGYNMFGRALLRIGTARAMKYIRQVLDGNILGALAMTEVGHGTNAQGLRTEATYDCETREFILNTPDFEAAKCWANNLGKTCTHAVVIAQLYTPDGANNGLNGFIVPIRNHRTLETLPGLVVGDLGEKIGLNSIDNGFLMFRNYRIPKENLLARFGDIDNSGVYESSIKDKRKRLNALLGTISESRVMVCSIAYVAMCKAVTIATRYSAARRQFAPHEDCAEWPIIEYQSQQYRILPHLANTYAALIFTTWLCNTTMARAWRTYAGYTAYELDHEIHALSSAAKPICSWTASDAITECREACGGHGYLRISGFGDLRADNDANCTHEGENNILIQQTSNWLIKLHEKKLDLETASPLGTASFIGDMENILATKAEETTAEQAMKPENLLKALDWLCAWQLQKTLNRVQELRPSKKHRFELRNEIQVFNAQLLSIVYVQRTIFFVFYRFIQEAKDTAERDMLTRILSFYGANLIMKHAKIFYQGGYFTDNDDIDLYEDGILQMLPLIKDEAVALVDAIAPTDFILNSPLGMSDGNVYEHLYRAVMSSPGVLERPKWWQEVIDKSWLKD